MYNILFTVDVRWKSKIPVLSEDEETGKKGALN